jgi:hypothetical protein
MKLPVLYGLGVCAFSRQPSGRVFDVSPARDGKPLFSDERHEGWFYSIIAPKQSRGTLVAFIVVHPGLGPRYSEFLGRGQHLALLFVQLPSFPDYFLLGFAGAGLPPPGIFAADGPP